MMKNIRPGVTVEFTDTDGDSYCGEILFSDDNQKVFLLKCPVSSGRQDVYDVFLHRHDNVKQMRLMKQANSFSFPELDVEKIATRSLKNEKQEYERLKLFEPDVSKEVRDLFEHLSKTLPGDTHLPVRWRKPDMHVLEQTVIKPPYLPENVLSKNNSAKAKSERDYVRKLVDKFHSEKSSV